MHKDIETKLTKLDTYFRETNPAISERERVFSRALKLNEEVGELCEAVLSEQDSNQRTKEKDIDLDAELADVLICTLMLAQARERDIFATVNAKLEKQMERFDLV